MMEGSAPGAREGHMRPARLYETGFSAVLLKVGVLCGATTSHARTNYGPYPFSWILRDRAFKTISTAFPNIPI